MIIEPSVTPEPSLLGPETISGSVCGACILNAATTGVKAAPLGTTVPIVTTGTNEGAVLDQSIIFFMAYQITSEIESRGICVKTTGSLIDLVPELSITKPAAADPTAFGSSVTTLFYSYLGFSSCNGNAIQLGLATHLVQVTTTTNSLGNIITFPSTSATSPSPAPNSNFPSPKITSAAENISPGFTTREKAATSVVVPVITIIAFVLGMIYLRRRRRKRSQSGKGSADPSEDNQPYLQQKAELEAIEKRRLELEAVEVRYEMDGGDDVKEMSAWGNEIMNEIDTLARPQMPSLKERHELKGEDCSKELEAP